jgi:hypothetical protein
MALLFKESNDIINAYHFHHYQSIPKVNQEDLFPLSDIFRERAHQENF